MGEAHVSEIAADLKSLVGYKATLHKLATMPKLLALAGAPDDAAPRHAGALVLEMINEGIDRISGEHHLRGFKQTLTSDQVKQALRMLLGLNRTSAALTAPERRNRTIKLLGLNVSIEQWRRPTGPEFDLMMILADQLPKGSLPGKAGPAPKLERVPIVGIEATVVLDDNNMPEQRETTFTIKASRDAESERILLTEFSEEAFVLSESVNCDVTDSSILQAIQARSLELEEEFEWIIREGRVRPAPAEIERQRASFKETRELAGVMLKEMEKTKRLLRGLEPSFATVEGTIGLIVLPELQPGESVTFSYRTIYLDDEPEPGLAFVVLRNDIYTFAQTAERFAFAASRLVPRVTLRAKPKQPTKMVPYTPETLRSLSGAIVPSGTINRLNPTPDGVYQTTFYKVEPLEMGDPTQQIGLVWYG